MSNPRRWLKKQVLKRVAARNEVSRTALGQQFGLPPETWGASRGRLGRLMIGGCDVTDIAERFGTPLYLVDEQKLRADYHRFADGLSKHYEKVEIGYSYKTNPLPEAIRILHDCGALAEVISHFELWLALKLGVQGEKIIFNGPAKTELALDLAVRSDVRLINIDGMHEIELLATTCDKYHKQQRVGVRVVTSVGWQAQFGLRLSTGEAMQAFRRMLQLPQLLPIGLHVHLGTGIKNVQTYLQAVREMLEFARELKTQTGIEINYLDFGGGFGVPTVQPIDDWDARLMQNNFPVGPVDCADTPTIDEYAQKIAQLIRDFYPLTEKPTIAFEPGRALSSSAQSLLLKVLALKTDSDGTIRAILNGGKNFALPTGYEYHEILPVSMLPSDSPMVAINFYGPLCHPGDVLYVKKQFPPLKPGDLVLIMDAGAYFVPNQMNFSNPRPGAVLLANGAARLIRHPESFEDIVRNDISLENHT